MAKKLKLSPWHDGSVNPVHVGVYEVYCRCCKQNLWSLWNGKFFCICERQASLAKRKSTKDNDLKLVKWRGVLK